MRFSNLVQLFTYNYLIITFIFNFYQLRNLFIKYFSLPKAIFFCNTDVPFLSFFIYVLKELVSCLFLIHKYIKNKIMKSILPWILAGNRSLRIISTFFRRNLMGYDETESSYYSQDNKDCRYMRIVPARTGKINLTDKRFPFPSWHLSPRWDSVSGNLTVRLEIVSNYSILVIEFLWVNMIVIKYI